MDSYDTLDALKRAPGAVFGRLGYHHSCMLATIHSLGIVAA